MVRNRLEKGTNKITFVDGQTMDIKFFGVSSYERTNLRRLNRINEFDKKGKLSKADFHDDEFMAAILKRSVGNQLTIEDIKDMDYVEVEEDVLIKDNEDDIKKVYEKQLVRKDALKYLYDLYFGDLTISKKLKSTDMSTPNQDKN